MSFMSSPFDFRREVRRRKFGRRQDFVGESRAVQFVCGAHHFLAERGRCIAHERDVIAQFHRKAAGGFNAGIGKQTDDDHVRDALLFQLKVEIGVGKAALGPVLLDDDVAFLRHEVGMPFAAPRPPAKV